MKHFYTHTHRPETRQDTIDRVCYTLCGYRDNLSIGFQAYSFIATFHYNMFHMAYGPYYPTTCYACNAQPYLFFSLNSIGSTLYLCNTSDPNRWITFLLLIGKAPQIYSMNLVTTVYDVINTPKKNIHTILKTILGVVDTKTICGTCSLRFCALFAAFLMQYIYCNTFDSKHSFIIVSNIGSSFCDCMSLDSTGTIIIIIMPEKRVVIIWTLLQPKQRQQDRQAKKQFFVPFSFPLPLCQ